MRLCSSGTEFWEFRQAVLASTQAWVARIDHKSDSRGVADLGGGPVGSIKAAIVESSFATLARITRGVNEVFQGIVTVLLILREANTKAHSQIGRICRLHISPLQGSSRRSIVITAESLDSMG